MIKTLLLVATVLPMLAIATDIPEPKKLTITAPREEEWGSYRHAYKAAAFFEKFTRTRPLIQAHLQIRPNSPTASMTGFQVRLTGEKTDLDIPVDGIGRVTIPMLKQAYDEDAVLHLNRQKGDYYFSGRYSITERDDGVYDATDLRSACDQLLSAQRESGYRLRLIGKKCAGVKFIYPLGDSAVSIDFRSGDKRSIAIAVTEGQPFEDNSMGLYRIAVYRFADWPLHGKIIANTRPLAIGTLYD